MASMSSALNADLRVRVVMDTASMPWTPSPSLSVFRKRLHLVGGAESGQVTSVVRYERGATFPAHGHPEGEEILVLSGVFSDDRGDHEAGTYLLNPPGFTHAPSSRDGCLLFVKLRQYGGEGRQTVAMNTQAAAFEAGPEPGVERLLLYRQPGFPEAMWLVRMAAGAATAREALPGGEEVFVVSGAFEDDEGSYPEGTWLRQPPGSSSAKRSPRGALLYMKQGHLGA